VEWSNAHKDRFYGRSRPRTGWLYGQQAPQEVTQCSCSSVHVSREMAKNGPPDKKLVKKPYAQLARSGMPLFTHPRRWKSKWQRFKDWIKVFLGRS